MKTSPTHVILLISGLATLWQFADPRGAISLFAIHGISRELIWTQPWRFFTTALLHGGILHFVFNALWAVRLGVPFESRYGNRDESMGTLVVWFALGFVLSWLRVLPIDNVAHTAGGTAGALGAFWTYRSEWKRSRSMGKRRKAWKRAMNAEPTHVPDSLSVALRERDLSTIQPAFEDPDLVKHTPVHLWDQWTEELITSGDEENAQRTLSVAIALASPSDRSLRLMRLSNLKFRSGDTNAAIQTLDQVNASQLRAEERELYDTLRKRSS